MQLYYLLGLIGGLVGMGAIDYRLKLALWHDRIRTLLTIAIAVGIFTIWDILGILLEIFYAGPSPYFLTLRLLPQFPVEEVFFLTLLCYTTLIVYRFGARR